jgi:hypothetical protein
MDRMDRMGRGRRLQIANCKLQIVNCNPLPLPILSILSILVENCRIRVVVPLVLTAALVGCGTRAGNVGGGETQQGRAGQHVTSVVLAEKWSQLLFYLVPSSGSCPFQQSTSIQGGNIVQNIQYANCVTEKRTLFLRGDGSEDHTEVQLHFPDPAPEGSTQTATVGPTDDRSDPRCSPRGRIFRQNVQHTLEAGDAVSYDRERNTECTPTNPFDDTETWTGQVTFKSRPDATFSLRRANNMDTLRMTLRDGAVFTLTVPMRPRAVPQTPDFAAETTGSYTQGDLRLDFKLRGTAANPTTWNKWTLTAPDGVTGEFDLNPDFSGSGRFFRDGQLDSLITWNAAGTASVTLVSGDAATAGPSAAASDFLAHSWRALFAAAVR